VEIVAHGRRSLYLRGDVMCEMYVSLVMWAVCTGVTLSVFFCGPEVRSVRGLVMLEVLAALRSMLVSPYARCKNKSKNHTRGNGFDCRCACYMLQEHDPSRRSFCISSITGIQGVVVVRVMPQSRGGRRRSPGSRRCSRR